MTQTLYLLRHAKAEPWSPGIDDFARNLNAEGQQHMLRLSAWMKDNLPAPGTTLCSSSRRTRETIAACFQTWPHLAAQTEYLDDIYEASTGLLHSLAGRAFEDAESVFMVGHNPGFEYLAAAVLQNSDSERARKMSSGTLTVISFPNGYQLDSGQGVLQHRVSPADLSAD